MLFNWFPSVTIIFYFTNVDCLFHKMIYKVNNDYQPVFIILFTPLCKKKRCLVDPLSYIYCMTHINISLIKMLSITLNNQLWVKFKFTLCCNLLLYIHVYIWNDMEQYVLVANIFPKIYWILSLWIPTNFFYIVDICLRISVGVSVFLGTIIVFLLIM